MGNESYVWCGGDEYIELLRCFKRLKTESCKNLSDNKKRKNKGDKTNEKDNENRRNDVLSL